MNSHLLLALAVTLSSFARGQVSFGPSSKTSCESGLLLEPRSQKCFPAGRRGPCGPLMIFYPSPLASDSGVGFCDCEQGMVDELRPCRDSPLRKRIYNHKHKRCFTVFSQGPCKKGEWLVLSEKTSAPICELNRCPSGPQSRETDDQFWFWDPGHGRCFQTFSRGPCPAGLQLELVHNSHRPQCRPPSCSSSLAYGLRSASISCQPGSRLSYLTNSCRRLWKNFAFGRR